MKTYKIIPLSLSYAENMDMGIFTYRAFAGKKTKSVRYVWYIQGADKHILVDGGSDAKLAWEFAKRSATDVASFEESLSSVGLKPDDIDIVIQTHLHWDHVGNTHKCKNAKVLVQEDEFNFAFFPHPILASAYSSDLIKKLNFKVIRGHYEVASGIHLIPSPGHTPGCQSVAVNTEKGKAIITGFCCMKENFDPPAELKHIMPVIAPGTHLNPVEGFESACRIKEMADILLPLHDPSFLGVKSIP